MVPMDQSPWREQIVVSVQHDHLVGLCVLSDR
jgi:hypothetical protein